MPSTPTLALPFPCLPCPPVAAQAKCESVIDLEIGLDEARESYTKLLWHSTNRVLKQRVLMLEQQVWGGGPVRCG